MKSIISAIVIFLSLLSVSSFTYAAEDDRYVIDVIWVSLRGGPGTEFKILDSGLRSGTFMKVIGTSEDGKWLNVILQNSKKTEGWIPERYVTSTPIARDRLKAAETEIESLKAKLSKTANSLESLKAVSVESSQDLSAIQKERDAIQKELEHIQEISANAITLNMRNGELLEENGQLKNELDVLKIENQYLHESNVTQEWLVGGGIAFIGLLAGIFLARGGKRTGAKTDSWA